VIEVLECAPDNTCRFIINGVKTEKIPVSKNNPSFSLINFHSLEILSIDYNQCDLEMCRPVYDTYTKVRVAVR
jgi:hypothetical protein